MLFCGIIYAPFADLYPSSSTHDGHLNNIARELHNISSKLDYKNLAKVPATTQIDEPAKHQFIAFKSLNLLLIAFVAPVALEATPITIKHTHTNIISLTTKVRFIGHHPVRFSCVILNHRYLQKKFYPCQV